MAACFCFEIVVEDLRRVPFAIDHPVIELSAVANVVMTIDPDLAENSSLVVSQSLDSITNPAIVVAQIAIMVWMGLSAIS